MDNLFSKAQPVEQSRWNQSNIDTLFYSGAQQFVNRYFNYSPNTASTQYYFNLCQQPINLITGYQRQHRKSFNYVPADAADPQTTDQYTRLIINEVNRNGIHEQFSRACEQSAITGMVLMQPYLDFLGDDPAQGELKVKLWEYNSFLVDPYFRNYDMSDCQFVWCQEYISKREAESRFPGQADKVSPMMASPQRYGRFYFLPENYNMNRSDLMILSYIWYKWKKKKKRIYSKSRNQFFDFGGGDEQLEMLLGSINDFEEVTVEVPSWKCAVVLNDQLMWQGFNPLSMDECPFVMVPWNYEPHNNFYDLRVRGLIRPMRDPQFLFNHKVITNNDIAAATINAGYMRKSGAVANEDNLKKAGQGYDIIINDGYELTDCQKIIPSAVPESDLALAQQMADLIFQVSGINLENWSGQDDKQTAALTVLLKQAANLMVFQKYFDQWDAALKFLGDRLLLIAMNNWNAAKVKLIIGEEPTPFFYSRIFAKFQTVVEEGLLTATQKNMAAQQKLDINAQFQREVFPASMIVKDMNIQDKANTMKFFEQQEQQQAAMQEHAQHTAQVLEEAKVKELYSKAAANVATARERHGRYEADLGLLEERLAEIGKNNSLSAKHKAEAIKTIVETAQLYGQIETDMAKKDIEEFSDEEVDRESMQREEAKRSSMAAQFSAEILHGMHGQAQGMGQQAEGQ